MANPGQSRRYVSSVHRATKEHPQAVSVRLDTSIQTTGKRPTTYWWRERARIRVWLLAHNTDMNMLQSWKKKKREIECLASKMSTRKGDFYHSENHRGECQHSNRVVQLDVCDMFTLSKAFAWRLNINPLTAVKYVCKITTCHNIILNFFSVNTLYDNPHIFGKSRKFDKFWCIDQSNRVSKCWPNIPTKCESMCVRRRRSARHWQYPSRLLKASHPHRLLKHLDHWRGSKGRCHEVHANTAARASSTSTLKANTTKHRPLRWAEIDRLPQLPTSAVAKSQM